MGGGNGGQCTLSWKDRGRGVGGDRKEKGARSQDQPRSLGSRESEEETGRGGLLISAIPRGSPAYFSNSALIVSSQYVSICTLLNTVLDSVVTQSMISLLLMTPSPQSPASVLCTWL